METKRCYACGIEKLLEEFYKCKSHRDGYGSLCKECDHKRSREYRQEHKVEIIVRRRKYRERNKEIITKSKQEYYVKNKKKINKKNQEYRQNHKKEIAQRMHNYYPLYREDNKEKISINQRINYKKNKKAITERHYRYCQTHKVEASERHRKYYQSHKKAITERLRKYELTENGKLSAKRRRHNRRARMRNTKATLTVDQWNKILTIQNNHCNTCGKRFTIKRPPTADHIIPLSAGGGLTFENVQALCGSCNSAKQAKLDPQFIQTWTHERK